MKMYLVGGAVRDRLMGISSHDTDYVVVGSSIEKMLSKGFIPIGKSFPVFIRKGDRSEYALARKEIKTGPKHTDFSFIFDESISLEEDLSRRDFTCNAIAYDEEENKYIDYHNGIKDISNKILRHINSHFCEDPLRVLRLCRFVAQLDFSVAPETLKICKKMVSEWLPDCLSAERIWSEIKRALRYPHFHRFVETAQECGILKIIMPALEKLWFVENRSGKKMKNTIDCLKKVATDSEIVKFATLLHQVGETGILEDPNLSEIEREQLGVSIIKEICLSLKIPSDYQKFAVLTCRNHKNFSRIDSMRLEDLLDMVDDYTKKMPEHFEDFISSLKIEPMKSDEIKKSEEKIRKIYSILSEISACDMPNFEELKKDESFKDKYRAFRLEVLKGR